MAPLAAGTITLTTMNVAHSSIAGGYQVTDGSNNGLSWTNLKLIVNDQKSINLTGTFSCGLTIACNSTTIKFNFTGMGFDVGGLQIGDLTGFTTGLYTGNFNFSNSAAPVVSTYINAIGSNGAISLQAPPDVLASGSFTGQGNFYVGSLAASSVLTLSGTGAQISFVSTPEPAAASVMGAGLLMLAGFRTYLRRRNQPDSTRLRP